MSSLDELRRTALDAVRGTNWADARDRFSTESFLMAYNSSVPVDYRVGRSVVLTAELGDLQASSRLTGRASLDLSQAVAFMAKDIAKPGSAARLTESDYERTPIMQTVSGNVLMLSTPRTDIETGLFDGVEIIENVTGMALERLVALMPSGPEVTRVDLDAILSTRPASRRAIGKLVEVAARSGGVSLSVGGGAQPHRSEVSTSLAESIQSAMDFEDTKVTTTRVLGYLEGARTLRRRFYLMPESRGGELWGSVDEQVVGRMATMVDHSVVATLEVTQTTERSGRPRRLTYRLVDIDRIAESPPLI